MGLDPAGAEHYGRARGTDLTEQRDAQPDAERNTYLDLIRVVAIAAVVIGHWLATGITYRHGQLHGVDVLGVVAWTSWLTLVVQVVPLFFLVGGYANALSWSRFRANGPDDRGAGLAWIRRRAMRLLLPTSGYVLAVSLAIAICTAVGIHHADVEQAAWAVSLHLWFLAVYLLLLLLTPMLYSAHQRWGFAVLVAMAAVAVVIDVGVIEWRWHLVGWANYLLVWGIFHQLGFAWHDGLFAGRRSWPFVLTLGAIAVLVGLIWWGPYPVSMVGVPGARIQNASPPSAALLAFGVAQCGAVMALAPRASAFLARRTRVRSFVRRANDLTMPVYLWHMVPVVIVAVAAYPTRILAQPSIGSGAWWTQRLIWIGALAVALAVTLAVVVIGYRGLARGRRSGLVTERVGTPARAQPVAGPAARSGARPAARSGARPAARSGAGPADRPVLRGVALGVGIVLAAAGVGRLAVEGFAPDGTLDVPTVAGFVVGVVMVAGAGMRRDRRAGGGVTHPSQLELGDAVLTQTRRLDS